MSHIFLTDSDSESYQSAYTPVSSFPNGDLKKAIALQQTKNEASHFWSNDDVTAIGLDHPTLVLTTSFGLQATASKKLRTRVTEKERDKGILRPELLLVLVHFEALPGGSFAPSNLSY
jgi:hypothetical protein